MERFFDGGAKVKLANKIKNKIMNMMTTYDADERIKQVETELSKLGLSYSDGKLLIKEFVNSICHVDLKKSSMVSNHWLIFAIINSIYDGKKFSNIMEIGTYDGITTTLLANLFRDSTILTLDLNDTDELFLETYNRSNTYIDFVKKRDRLLGLHSNIIQKQKNSFSLTYSEDKKYDLIWVDGAHGYPTIVSDIVNAYRLLKDGGFLMVDDVISDKLIHQDTMYYSEGAQATLSELIKLEAFQSYGFPLKRIEILSSDKVFNNKKIFVGQKKKQIF